MSESASTPPPAGLPLSLVRAWCFRAALMKLGFVDAEIVISGMATLASLPEDGRLPGLNPNEPDIAVCVTVTRDKLAWSAPLAPWLIEPQLLAPAWRRFRAMVEHGNVTPEALAEASRPHVFDEAWMRQALQLRGMLPREATP